MYNGLNCDDLIGCLSNQGKINKTKIAPNIKRTPPSLSGTLISHRMVKIPLWDNMWWCNHRICWYVLSGCPIKFGKKNTAAAKKVKNTPSPNKSLIV